MISPTPIVIDETESSLFSTTSSFVSPDTADPPARPIVRTSPTVRSGREGARQFVPVEVGRPLHFHDRLRDYPRPPEVHRAKDARHLH